MYRTLVDWSCHWSCHLAIGGATGHFLPIQIRPLKSYREQEEYRDSANTAQAIEGSVARSWLWYIFSFRADLCWWMDEQSLSCGFFHAPTLFWIKWHLITAFGLLIPGYVPHLVTLFPVVIPTAFCSSDMVHAINTMQPTSADQLQFWHRSVMMPAKKRKTTKVKSKDTAQEVGDIHDVEAKWSYMTFHNSLMMKYRK